MNSEDDEFNVDKEVRVDTGTKEEVFQVLSFVVIEKDQKQHNKGREGNEADADESVSEVKALRAVPEETDKVDINQQVPFALVNGITSSKAFLNSIVHFAEEHADEVVGVVVERVDESEAVVAEVVEKAGVNIRNTRAEDESSNDKEDHSEVKEDVNAQILLVGDEDEDAGNKEESDFVDDHPEDVIGDGFRMVVVEGLVKQHMAEDKLPPHFIDYIYFEVNPHRSSVGFEGEDEVVGVLEK